MYISDFARLGQVSVRMLRHYDELGLVSPSARSPAGYRLYDDDGCYKEEYMCVETGVGSGTLWTYGKNIFSNEADAQRGVIKHQQAAHKERARRDADRAAQEVRRREADLATLQRLQAQYGTADDVAA